MIQDPVDTSRLRALMQSKAAPSTDSTDRLRSLMGLRPKVDPQNDQRVTIPEAAAHMSGAAVRGLVGVGSRALTGIAALTDSEDGWAMNSARWLNESANVGYSEDVARLGGVTEFATDVAGGLGSLAGQGLAFAAGVAGAPETGGASIAIPLITTGLVSALGNGGDLYWETKAAGGSDEDAIVAGLVGGGLGATDALPIAKLLGKNPALKNKALRWFIAPTGSSGLERTLHQTLTEGGQEFLQGLGNAATLAQTAGKPVDLGDVLREGGVGAVVGLLTGGGAEIARGRKAPAESAAKRLEAVPAQESALASPSETSQAVEQFEAAAAVQMEQGPGDITAEPVTTEPLPTKAGTLPSAWPQEALPEQVAGAPVEPSQAPDTAVTPPSPTAEEPGDLPITGIKNAQVDAERAALGLEPATHGEKRSWELAASEADALLEREPGMGTRLAREVMDSPRPLTDTEGMVLLQDRTRLHNERQRLESELKLATDKGEPIMDLVQAIQRVQDESLRNDEAATLAGTKNAQALAMRRAMMKADYSLAAMETAARVAKKGEKLSARESAEIAELHEAIKRVQAQLDAVAVQVQSEKVKRATTRAAATPRGEHIRSFLKEKADAARARIRERAKTVRMHSGAVTQVEVEEIIDHAIIGAEKLASGLIDFAQWSEAMLAEAGERIRPHLRTVYERSVDIHDEAGKQSSKLAGYKTRTENRIKQLEERIRKGEAEPKRASLVLDKPAIELKAELKRTQDQYRAMLQRLEHEKRTPEQKLISGVKETINLPKAILSSWDMSAVGRQGWFFSMAHPVQTLRLHIPAAFKALASEDAARQIDVQLRDTDYRPLAEVGHRAGLELVSLDGKLSSQEEAIKSELSDKIPGLRASNRAFVTFMNMQRAAAFDDMYRGVPGPVSDAQAQDIAYFVNIATGRGYVPGKLKGAVNGLSTILWSPRLHLSRFQLLAEPLRQAKKSAFKQSDKTTRKLIAKEYARNLIGLSAVYAMLKTAAMFIDDEDEKPAIGTNTNSTDFGKVRIGGTTIDPLGGLSQLTVLGSRLATGIKTQRNGKEVPIRGKVPYGKDTANDIVADFLRYKLSPTVAIPYNWIVGENAIGEPVGVDATVQAFKEDPVRATLGLGPLSFQDIYDAMRAKGVPAGAALGILSTFGFSVQTYGDRK